MREKKDIPQNLDALKPPKHTTGVGDREHLVVQYGELLGRYKRTPKSRMIRKEGWLER